MISRKATETKTLTPNFASGNVDVTPTFNKTMTKVTIQKDSDLIAGNVKKDVEIHGITGSYEGSGGATSGDYEVNFQYLAIESGELVPKIYTTYVNAGGSVTAPTISTTLTAVTNQSPALEIDNSDFYWNVITRVHVPTDNPGVIGASITESTWIAYSVIVSNGIGAYRFKYESSQWNLYKYVDGSWSSIASNITLSNYGIVIRGGISAAEGDYIYVNYKDWTNFQSDCNFCAVYKPQLEDGFRKSYAFITLTANTGLAPSFLLYKTDGSTLTISWGDGTSDYTSTATGNVSTSHTYSTAGSYVIKLWISSGSGEYQFNQGSTNTTWIGNTTANYKSTLKYMYLGEKVARVGYGSAWLSCDSLEIFTCQSNPQIVGGNAFNYCYSLKFLSLPPSIITIGAYAFQYAEGCDLLVLPSAVSSLGSNFIDSAVRNKNLVIHHGLAASIGNSSWYSCYSLSRITLPSSLAGSGLGATHGYCYSLRKINIPKGITTIGTSCFAAYQSLEEISIPASVTTLSSSAFANCHNLRRITIPASVSTINASTFSTCSSLKELTLLKYTAPSTITTLANVSALENTPPSMRIYVPVGSLSTYQAATNWSTYANRMYEDTPENRALFGD